MHGSKRSYWLGGERKRWLGEVSKALDESDLAHTGMADLYRPLSRDALEMALRRNMTNVFFVDTDIVAQIQALLAAGLMRRGPDRAIYLWYYDKVLRSIVARSDLSFLKGSALFDRYGAGAKNAKIFHDTSYQSSEIVADAVVAGRIENRASDAPLKLVYCGRLVARKGCDRSLEIVARARALGANVTFTLIGDGPERAALEAQSQEMGLGTAVQFLGEKPYGPELIRELADYDALLFTPAAEDTPRMIFDAYAAGLPMVGADIPYVRERHDEEKATVLLPQDNPEAAAEAVVALATDPDRLATLAWAALSAGRDNATDVWYRRRASWTMDVHRDRA
jgi:glycosyltransferase involved in cell wall biosynthesis